MRIYQVVSQLLVLVVLSSCANMQTGGGMRSDSLDNQGEATIFLQAVGVGAGLGLGVGLLACNKLEGLAKNLCIASTTAAGGGIGYFVARQQIKSVKHIQLEGDQLENLLSEAQQYNSKIAADNVRLRQVISSLRVTRTTRANKLKLIQQRLQEARYRRGEVMKALEMRRTMTAKLSDSNQRSRYESTLNELENEISQIEDSIRELEQYAGEVRVGA